MPQQANRAEAIAWQHSHANKTVQKYMLAYPKQNRAHPIPQGSALDKNPKKHPQ